MFLIGLIRSYVPDRLNPVVCSGPITPVVCPDRRSPAVCPSPPQPVCGSFCAAGCDGAGTGSSPVMCNNRVREPFRDGARKPRTASSAPGSTRSSSVTIPPNASALISNSTSLGTSASSCVDRWSSRHSSTGTPAGLYRVMERSTSFAVSAISAGPFLVAAFALRCPYDRST